MIAARRVLVASVARVLALVIALGCGGARPAGGAPPSAPGSAAASGSAARPGAPGPTAGQSLHWTGRLTPGRTMEVRTVLGTVRAVAASDDVAVIDATLTPASPAPADARTTLRIKEDNGGVSLRTETREGDGDHECACDDRGRRPPRVDVLVRVPAGMRLVVHTVEARIDAEGLQGPVELHTVDGAIDARGVTSAQARTVNGPIHVGLTQPELAEDMELSTVNGTVDVGLPASTNAELAASTVNGEVHFDLPPAPASDSRGLRMTLGHGGKALRLRTVNGMISVKRGS